MATAIEHSEWVAKYSKMRAIAERIDKYRHDRARQACQAAGLDPGIIGIHVHNALCGLSAGRPWPGVDYSLVRKANWLMDRAYDGYRIVERWDHRVREIA